MRFFSHLAALFGTLYSSPRTSTIPNIVPARQETRNPTQRGHVNTNPNWLKIALNQK